MDKFKELYQYLVDNEMTDLSEEEFKVEYAQGTDKNSTLFTYLQDNELTDLDQQAFNSKYFPQQTQVDVDVVTDEVTDVKDGQEVDSSTMVEETVAYDPREQGMDDKISYNNNATIFEKSLAYVTPDLIDREEEEVVNRMNYHFGDYGFTFEEGGGMMSGMDGMSVRAENGQTIKVDLDPVLGDLTGNFFGTETKQANKLKDFLKKNKKINPELEAFNAENNRKRKKYFSKKAVDEDLDDLKTKATSINKRAQVYQTEKTKHEQAMDGLMMVPPQERGADWQLKYQQQLGVGKRLNELKQTVSNELKSYRTIEKQVHSSVGNYMEMKANDGRGPGTFLKGFYNSVVGRGVSQIFAYGADLGIDALYGIGRAINEDFSLRSLSGVTEEEKKERYITIAKDLGYDVPTDVMDSDESYQNWLNSLSEEDEMALDGDTDLFTSQLNKEGRKALKDSGKELKNINGKLQLYNPKGGIFGKGGYEDVPADYLDKNKREKLDRLVADAEVKSTKKPTKEFIKKNWNQLLSFDDVSDEKIAEMRDDNIIAEGLLGLGESLPAIGLSLASRGKIKATGQFATVRNILGRILGLDSKGGVAQVLAFSALQAEAMQEEMDADEDFKYVTEGERKLILGPTALTVAVLERYGLRNLLKNKTIMTGLMSQVTKVLPQGASATLYKSTLEKIVKSNIAKGLYTNKAVKFSTSVAKAALSEAETGGLQQIAEMGYKDIWNDMNEKEMFDQPEMWSKEFWQEAKHAAMAEAVGGFVMGIPGGIVNAYKVGETDNISDATLELFDAIRGDNITMKAYKEQLSLQVADGTKTQKEADEELLQFQTLSGAANTIPVDLDITARKKALGLIFERQGLEAEMEGMDKDLGSYKKKEARVQEIKNELSQIGSEQADDSASLEKESENIPIFVSEEKAKEELVKEGIANPTQEQIKEKQDALQKPETTSMDVRQSPGDGKTMGKGNKGTTTQQSTQENKDASQTKSEEKVTKEEQEDIDAFFGEEVGLEVESSSDNLSINRQQKDGSKVKDTKLSTQIIRRAKLAAKAIKKIAPNVKMVLHQTTEEFEKYAPKGRGYYNPNSKVIHINLANAKNNTVAHEVFHAVFLEKIAGGDKAAIAAADRLIKSVRKSLPNDSMLAQRIDAFAENYKDSAFQSEERVAELFSLMATEYKSLTKPAKNRVVEFIKSVAKKLGIKIPNDFTSSDEAVVDFLNTFSKKVQSGEEVLESDLDALSKLNEEVGLDINQEQGSEGQVGTFTFTGRSQKAPIVSTDKREFSSLIKEKNLEDFKGQKFITNMYDFTSAGSTEIASGITLDLYGGKNYVPLMMQSQNLKIGDVSNLAAFNSKAQAEGFIRNSKESGATLFAPHVGTKEGSWQFQQNIFEQLTFAALDNKILTNTALINTFNEALTSKEGKAAFNTFKKKLGTNIKNFNSFKSNPRELLELLDINNNYSPNLRKLLNDKLSANKAYQEALGVKNKNDFAQKFEDPLNVGSKGGDIIGIVEFDNTNFEVTRPNPGDVDYHPSFAYTIKTKINGIYQPTNFYQSSQVTDSYTKYNKEGAKVSTKENTKDFEKSNVTSSAGSIPKVAQVSEQAGRQQRDTLTKINVFYNMSNSGFFSPQVDTYRLQKELDALNQGYKLRQAPYNQYGQGGGYSIYDSRGKRVRPPKDSEYRQGRQQKMDKENDLLKIIIIGREQAGFRDAAIKDYLKRRKKEVNGKLVPAYSASEINNAMEVVQGFEGESYLFTEFPKSFNNMEGGFLAGLKLLKKVNTYYKRLIKANNKKKSVAVDGTPLTEEQIRQKVIDYFTGLQEYQNEGAQGNRLTAQQMAMEKDLLELLLPDPLKANPQRIRAINKRIKEIKFDEKNIKAVQRALRNYIRSVLPRDLYTKSEIVSLIDKVNRINKENFDSVKDEVFKVVTSKTNKSLQESIFNILNRKFTTIQSGRLKGVSIDNETRKKIERINSMIVNPKSTADEIMEANEQLLKEYNSIAKEEVSVNKETRTQAKSSLDEDALSRLAEITIAMQINNSFLAEMNDPNKTTLLSEVLNSLNQMQETGRANLEYVLLNDAITYRENERKVFKEMTGIDLDAKQSLIDQGVPENEITEGMINVEFNKLKQDVSVDAKRKGGLKPPTVRKRFQNLINKMLNSIDRNVFASAEDLTGLIDRIVTQPGELFEGDTQTIVQKAVREATRMYKARMMGQKDIFENKMTELFGKRWLKNNAKNSQQTETIIVSQAKNDQLIKEKEKVMADKSLTSGEQTAKVKELDDAIDTNTIYISQNQLMYYYSQMQDPSLQESFINTFAPTGNYKNEFESRIRKELEDKLDPRLKEFSSWMINDYYPSLYNHYNETYKQIYRTDMPWNQFYAGRVYRKNANDSEGLDLLADNNNTWMTNVGAASSKVRLQNSNPISMVDGMDALINYTKDMEYFAAYAVPVRNINKIFTSPAIKETIQDKYGKDVWTYINNAIEKIANKGVQNQGETKVINLFNNTFLLSRLGLNPTLTLKQLTSFVTYGNEIGYGNWLKNSAISLANIKTNFREVMDNSVILQDRYGKPITRAVENYSDSKFEEMNARDFSNFGLGKQNLDKITKVLMFTTMTGDKGAILIGGIPNYVYYKNQYKKKNPNASKQEVIDYAIRKFEQDTLRTQQSYDLQDKDYYQGKGAMTRAFNMFLTTPKQYFRKEIIAMRNIYRLAKSGGFLSAKNAKSGRGTMFQNLRTLGVYHVVMPVFFQWVSSGFPGLARGWDDEDTDDIAFAAMLGNLNALFIYGKIAETIVDAAAGKPWVDKPSTIPVLGQTALLGDLYVRMKNAKSPAKQQENFNKLMSELVATTGIPAPQLKRFYDNWSKLDESKSFGDFVLKLFNFSQYAQKKNKKSGGGLTTAEKKKYFPDLFPDDLEGTSEANEIKKEQRRMRQELLDDMF